MSTAILVAGRAYSALKGSLALVGLAAVGLLAALPQQRQALLGDFQPLAALNAEADAFVSTIASGPIQAGGASDAQEREQRAVAEFIARRYRVSERAVQGFVAAAYRDGAQYSVDPLLILAVMAVESRYNPVAESVMGAKGLMQIMPKQHADKLADRGGEQALLDPDTNIEIGTQILREYSRRFGDVETALQIYAGAIDEPSSQYAAKVLAEKARLEALRQKAKKQSA